MSVPTANTYPFTGQFVVASAVALAAAMTLNSIVPRLYPWGDEEPHPPGHGAT